MPDASRPRFCTHRPRLGFNPALLAGLAPVHAALVKAARWPTGKTLRVAFRGGTTADRDQAVAAMEEWSRYGNLDYVVVGAGDAEVRLLFDDSGASWSYVGTDALHVPPNEPTAVFGWRGDPGRDLHEFGHVGGYPHGDQIAPIPWNVPNVIRDYSGPPNHWSVAEIYAQVLDRDDPSTLSGVHWDPKSIMDYPIPPEHVTDPAFVVGWNQTLSPEDRAFHAACYPGRYEPRTPTPTQGPTMTPTPTPTPSNLTGVPTSAVASTAAATFALFRQGLTFIQGEVDFAALERLVLPEIVEGHGPSDVVAVIKAHEVEIFKDSLARFGADALLGWALQLLSQAKAKAPAA